MAIKTIKTVASNTAPPLLITCQRDGVVLNLTGCTAQVIIKSKSTGTYTNTGHQSASVVSPATNGIISYTRQAGDVSTAGTYICDVKITYADLSTEILYDQLKLKARAPA